MGGGWMVGGSVCSYRLGGLCLQGLHTGLDLTLHTRLDSTEQHQERHKALRTRDQGSQHITQSGTGVFQKTVPGIIRFLLPTCMSDRLCLCVGLSHGFTRKDGCRLPTHTNHTPHTYTPQAHPSLTQTLDTYLGLLDAVVDAGCTPTHTPYPTLTHPDIHPHTPQASNSPWPLGCWL